MSPAASWRRPRCRTCCSAFVQAQGRPVRHRAGRGQHAVLHRPRRARHHLRRYELVEATSPELATESAPTRPGSTAATGRTGSSSSATTPDARRVEASDAYQTLLDRVAAGDAAPDPGAARRPRDVLQQRLPEHLRRLVGLCFDLLNGLDAVRAGFGEEYLTGVLAHGSAARRTHPVRARSQRPRSTRPRRPRCRSPTHATTSRSSSCRISDVRRADGVGPAFTPQATLSPAEAELGPARR